MEYRGKIRIGFFGLFYDVGFLLFWEYFCSFEGILKIDIFCVFKSDRYIGGVVYFVVFRC